MSSAADYPGAGSIPETAIASPPVASPAPAAAEAQVHHDHESLQRVRADVLAALNLVVTVLTLITLVAAIYGYFSEHGLRVEQEHFQLWQVIDAAQGQAGSGGRIEAMQDLNRDHVMLSGLTATGATLRGVDLPGVHLDYAYLQRSDLRGANLAGADLRASHLQYVAARGVDLQGADLRLAGLEHADLSCLRSPQPLCANLAGAQLQGANVWCTNLIGAQHLSSTQIKRARNWREAILDPALSRQVGLAPRALTSCRH